MRNHRSITPHVSNVYRRRNLELACRTNSPRLCSIMIVLLVACSAISTADAKGRKRPPYKATIVKSDAFARSGPGRRYYPTSRFRKGDQVTVRRHDPGGWYMIEPPPGSFSWIRAEYIKRAAGNRGVVTENGIVVRIGSQFGDNHSIEQRRLSIGDDIEIIGAKTLQSDGRSIRMYQIKPPRGEYRWIKGDLIIAEGESPRKLPSNGPLIADNLDKRDTASSRFQNSGDADSTTHPRDPFIEIEGPVAVTDDENAKQKNDSAADADNLVKRPVVKTLDPSNSSKSNPGASVTPVVADHQRLDQLDETFRTIIKRDTAKWNFSKLDGDYRQLQKSTVSPVLASEVDRRLAALIRYQRIKHEYEEFVRLTSETDKRDAQLLSLRRKQQEQLQTKPSSTTVRRNLNAPDPRTATPRDPAKRMDTKPRKQGQLRFSGAGIVQRSATTYSGAPRHVLLAPNGRILAYLQSEQRGDAQPTVNLDRFLGRAMGVVGARSFRRELQTDLIIVREVSPVKLKP